MTNKRHERVSLPRFQRYDAPREVVDLARRRTEFLTRWLLIFRRRIWQCALIYKVSEMQARRWNVALPAKPERTAQRHV